MRRGPALVRAWPYRLAVGIVHARDELLALASACNCTTPRTIAGWSVDDWVLTPDDIDAAIATYEAVLTGGATPDAHAILAAAGVDLDALLKAPASAVDLVTRADVVELVAAAAHIGWDDWPVDPMQMPNIPKMARGKSDSGLDIATVTLDGGTIGRLGQGDQLFVSSVKHVEGDNTTNLRYNLVHSVTTELTPVYMANQLRYLNGELLKAGVPDDVAGKVFLFLRNWPDFDHVHLHAVAGVAPTARTHLETQLKNNLPAVTSGRHGFRVLVIQELKTLHERCP
jgi:hypothetical protein